MVICDQSEHGFGWIAPEPAWMGRTGHALAAEGGVWLVDPIDVDGLDARVALLGEPRGILQLLGRHRRDCAVLAARLGVPLECVPTDLPGTPFQVIALRSGRTLGECALWWPQTRTLVVADALGTVRYFCAPGRRLGVNPLWRVVPPPRALLGVEPEHILCGHGRGIHEDATAALRDAVTHARRELPRVLPRVLSARRHAAV